jgi:DNA polymerase
VAAKALLDTTLGITRLRGSWKAWPLPGGGEARVMPTFHPAYLLRSPEYKGLTFEDLKKVRVALDSPRAP